MTPTVPRGREGNPSGEGLPRCAITRTWRRHSGHRTGTALSRNTRQIRRRLAGYKLVKYLRPRAGRKGMHLSGVGSMTSGGQAPGMILKTRGGRSIECGCFAARRRGGERLLPSETKLCPWWKIRLRVRRPRRARCRPWWQSNLPWNRSRRRRRRFRTPRLYPSPRPNTMIRLHPRWRCSMPRGHTTKHCPCRLPWPWRSRTQRQRPIPVRNRRAVTRTACCGRPPS
mmetsp:Transcript_12425/g.30374  ORF Transcript_12425/g.30374 Transcript_12425/m.30374 type:complete len:227 (-) Transcript_12425:659-1339(-)